MRREQEFVGHSALEGATHVLEYGNFFFTAIFLVVSFR